jgi:hypothetical protein
MRLVAASTLALFATSAIADNIVMDDPSIKYVYTYETLGSLHFCDLATVIAKTPLAIKLTSAFVTDDAKPKNKDVTVVYIVDAFVAGIGKNSQLEFKQVKVVASSIISDSFHSDLHAIKNIDSHLGASYTIRSEGSVGLFTNLMLRGAYALAVEFENSPSLKVDVRPTAEILDPSEKWTKCSIAIMEHRPPQ